MHAPNRVSQTEGKQNGEEAQKNYSVQMQNAPSPPSPFFSISSPRLLPKRKIILVPKPRLTRLRIAHHAADDQRVEQRAAHREGHAAGVATDADDGIAAHQGAHLFRVLADHVLDVIFADVILW